MAHPLKRPPGGNPEGIDLFRQYVAHGAATRDYLGAYPGLVDAKRRSRIEYRAGVRGYYLAIDRRTGRAMEQWEVVGRDDKAGGPDCVKVWPPDPDDTPPAAVVQLPARIAERLRRSRAA